MSTRPSRIAVPFLLLASACATTAHDAYADLEDAMDADVDPLVNELLSAELNKDADKVDFESIRRGAMRVRSIFRQAQDPGRALYLKNAKDRAAAKTAAGWFRDIAAAATLKHHGKLVDLYKQKQTICTSCHDEH